MELLPRSLPLYLQNHSTFLVFLHFLYLPTPPKGVTVTPDIPDKQWAMVIQKTGGPVDYKQIPDEILVNIKYSGVCHTDIHAVNGDWPLPTKLPLIDGLEGAGIVVARGELVEDVEIGDHAGITWLNGSLSLLRLLPTSRRTSAPQSPPIRLHHRRHIPDNTSTHIARIPKEVHLDAVAPILCAASPAIKVLKFQGSD
ncbi:MAG: hypothetical protein Q9208_000180 [Pyrenodesmia sp. 3 TL-2023]